MSRFDLLGRHIRISVNWLNEVDIANIGAEAAIRLKRGTNIAGGQDVLPIIQVILSGVYGAGKGPGCLGSD